MSIDPADEKLFLKNAKNSLISHLDRSNTIILHFKYSFISLICICKYYKSLNKKKLTKKVSIDPAEALLRKKFSTKFDANLCELYCLQICLIK